MNLDDLMKKFIAMHLLLEESMSEPANTACGADPASLRLADLADVYGYSDQAHLIREFKSFAHCTPRDFADSAPAYFELRQNEDWYELMKHYFDLS
jgi:AraC-like DNA-binding protein